MLGVNASFIVTCNNPLCPALLSHQHSGWQLFSEQRFFFSPKCSFSSISLFCHLNWQAWRSKQNKTAWMILWIGVAWEKLKWMFGKWQLSCLTLKYFAFFLEYICFFKQWMMFSVAVFVKSVLSYKKTFFSLSIYAFTPFFLPFNLNTLKQLIWNSNRSQIPIEAASVSFNKFLTLHRGNEQLEPCTVMCLYW